MTLKNKLKVLRAQYDYTQDDIANYLNIASSTYHNKEVGKTDFTLSECKKISKLFNKSLDEIFFTENSNDLLPFKVDCPQDV